MYHRAHISKIPGDREETGGRPDQDSIYIGPGKNFHGIISDTCFDRVRK